MDSSSGGGTTARPPTVLRDVVSALTSAADADACAAAPLADDGKGKSSPLPDGLALGGRLSMDADMDDTMDSRAERWLGPGRLFRPLTLAGRERAPRRAKTRPRRDGRSLAAWFNAATTRAISWASPPPAAASSAAASPSLPSSLSSLSSSSSSSYASMTAKSAVLADRLVDEDDEDDDDEASSLSSIIRVSRKRRRRLSRSPPSRRPYTGDVKLLCNYLPEYSIQMCVKKNN